MYILKLPIVAWMQLGKSGGMVGLWRSFTENSKVTRKFKVEISYEHNYAHGHNSILLGVA